MLFRSVDNHKQALEFVLEQLQDDNYGVISSLNEINAVGHRVVQGAEIFKHSVIITDEVIDQIESCKELAPIHTPPIVNGIRACKQVMPGKPMVAVFDTAFHQTIPEERYIYPIPYEYYEKYKVRKYGFHGTSHKYVSQRVAELTKKPVEELKTVVCHLGQGASLCAVDGGKSVETSMGITPVSGIMMCARSGDLDPSVVTFLMKKERLNADNIEDILNKESGVLGISGISPDFRDIVKEANEGNKRAILSVKAYCYNVAQFIAKYGVSMNGIDNIVFTAGIGENQIGIRKAIGADTILFHTGYKGTKHTGSIFQFKKKFIDFWLDFIRDFEKSGITAVIENVFEWEPDFCIDLYECVSSDNFKLALDTGHVNLYAKETNVIDWIKAYSSNLHHMHIHNNFGQNDDHSNLLNGTLDFREIFDCIYEEGITPSMVLEMYSEEDILKSVGYLQNFNM